MHRQLLYSAGVCGAHSAMARFRFTSRVSVEIDDLHLTASISIGDSRPDDPVRRKVDDRRDLAAELAQYTTPSDLLDLEAALDRYDNADTQEIREILTEQARRRLISPRAHGPIG